MISILDVPPQAAMEVDTSLEITHHIAGRTCKRKKPKKHLHLYKIHLYVNTGTKITRKINKCRRIIYSIYMYVYLSNFELIPPIHLQLIYPNLFLFFSHFFMHFCFIMRIRRTRGP